MDVHLYFFHFFAINISEQGFTLSTIADILAIKQILFIII